MEERRELEDGGGASLGVAEQEVMEESEVLDGDGRKVAVGWELVEERRGLEEGGGANF